MAQDQITAVTDLRGNIQPVSYDSALIETAVRLRVDRADKTDAGWMAEYRRELDEIYELPEQSRESAFVALDRRYFQRIGISSVVDECLAARAKVLSSATSIFLITAQSRSEEGADVTADGRLVIRVRHSSLENIAVFRDRLRRELLQAADCLNPAFGHSPGDFETLMPSEKERIRTAFSSLWALSARIRLCSEEMNTCEEELPLASMGCLARLRDKTLTALGLADEEKIQVLFSRMPDHPPTFRRMLEFCKEHLGSEKVSKGICILCRFPSEDVRPLAALPPELGRSLCVEFPHLQADSPICHRCVERQDSILNFSCKKGAHT